MDYAALNLKMQEESKRSKTTSDNQYKAPQSNTATVEGAIKQDPLSTNRGPANGI